MGGRIAPRSELQIVVAGGEPSSVQAVGVLPLVAGETGPIYLRDRAVRVQYELFVDEWWYCLQTGP